MLHFRPWFLDIVCWCVLDRCTPFPKVLRCISRRRDHKSPAVPEVTAGCAESPGLGSQLNAGTNSTELLRTPSSLCFILQFIICAKQYPGAQVPLRVQCLGLEMLGGTWSHQKYMETSWTTPSSAWMPVRCQGLSRGLRLAKLVPLAPLPSRWLPCLCFLTCVLYRSDVLLFRVFTLLVI